MSDFVTIPEYPAYQINAEGLVRRPKKAGGYTAINPWLGDTHYFVTLHNESGRKCMRVHRLVLQTFGPPQPTDKPLALHLDDDPKNNRLSNLIWGDKVMNAQMAVANGRLCPPAFKTYLDREEAAMVRDLFATGSYSLKALAKQFGCSRWTISNIVHNRVARLAV